MATIFGAMAMSTSLAGASPNWMVGPKPNLPAELSAKAEKTLTLSTKIAGVATEFSCTGISLDSALLEAEGKATGKALFSGCVGKLNGVTSPACEPRKAGTEKGVIASNALKGQLLLHEGTTTLLKVSAVSGETFGTIETSEECSIGETVPVIGSLYLKDAGGEFELEKATHPLEVGPLTELWVYNKTAEHKATVGGKVAVSLTGGSLGSLWSGLGA